MTEHPNAAATRAAIEAFSKGDFETMVASLADDVVWHIPGSNRFAGEFRGKAAVVEQFRSREEAGVRTSIDEIHDVVGNDEHVVALVRVGVSSADDSTSSNSVWVMHVADGKMLEFWGANDNQAGIDRVFGS
ncbi:MAG: nuclear transport factor 2 family protein [Actinomycetota bacterium]